MRANRPSERDIQGHHRASAKIGVERAQLHAVFGLLYVLGLAMPA